MSETKIADSLLYLMKQKWARSKDDQLLNISIQRCVEVASYLIVMHSNLIHGSVL